MTIYVDDFHTLPASRIEDPANKFRVINASHMIGTDAAELHAFAMKLGIGTAYFQESGRLYRLPIEERRKAELLGATCVSFRTLAAMLALYHCGYDMEPADTASARRDELVQERRWYPGDRSDRPERFQFDTRTK